MTIENNNKMSPELFRAIQLTDIFNSNRTSVSLNSKIEHFNKIHKIFKDCEIKHECFTPNAEAQKSIVLHFGCWVNFQDLYIIVAILDLFELQKIFFLDNDDYDPFKINIGGYSTRDSGKGVIPRLILEEPLTLTTSEFVKKSSFRDNRPKFKPDCEYERDTFDALTGGQ